MIKTNQLLGLGIILMLAQTFPTAVYAQGLSYLVSDKATLVSRMTAANPGDTVVVANGSYDWGQINFSNTRGTATSAWIVLKAEMPNGVVFTRSTYLQFAGYRLLISGFKFANGNSGTNDVIQFRSSSSNLAYYSRVTNVTIDNYNSDSTGAYLGLATDVNNKWISIYGTNNRVDHCSLLNKTNAGATLVVWFVSVVYPAQSISTYHRIDSNFFRGRSYSQNGGESIRIGTSSVSRTNGYNVVEYNLFENMTQIEPEIISNKTNFNIYRYNTIRNCSGGLTLRHGRYCEAYGNFILRDNPSVTDAYGIRVIDKGHKVYNNYIEGVNGNKGSLSSMRSGISLYNGLYPSSDTTDPLHSSGYWPADSCIVAFNTIVNAEGGSGIILGHTDGGANIYQPLGMKISNNLIHMSLGQATYSDPANTLLTYSGEGNLFSAPGGLGNTSASVFSAAAVSFGARTNGILPPSSILQDAALNTAAYSSMLGGKDVQGLTRSSVFDVGCDELNGTGAVLYFPLDSTLVGAGTPVMRSQSITFPPLPVKTFGDADFTAGASASSGLSVGYSSSNTSVAAIVNGSIRITGAGTTVITASQPGNSLYLPAIAVAQTLTVNKQNQTITFAALPQKLVGDADFSPGATASSGLSVTYSSSNTAVATIVNNAVRIVAQGSTTITASQSGNSNYSPAADVSQVLTVNKQNQTITFAALPQKFVGEADFNPGATASSGLAVSYTSSNTAVATIVSNAVRIVGAGTSVITASQAGNTTYNAAASVVQTLTVIKQSQTITFPVLPQKLVGDADFSPGATASSGLAVTYSSSNTAVATIVNNNIRIIAAGTSVITASQAGNATYNAATSMTQTLTVKNPATFNYVPSAVTIVTGSLNSGGFGNLATNNSSYYVVNSTTSGTRVLDWYATLNITQAASTVTKLTISYDGKYSISRTQLLYLYNWATASWTQIDSRTVSTADVLAIVAQASPASFISSTGQIRVRVYSTGGTTTYRCSGDWLQVAVQTNIAARPSTAVTAFASASDDDITVWPNPVAVNGNIRYRLNAPATVNLLLYNTEGRLMKTLLENKFEQKGTYNRSYDVSGLPAGTYLVLFKTATFEKVIKLIVRK